MRFLSMVRIKENSDLQPSEQLMADMGRLIEEMTREGVLLDTAGLRPTTESVRVKLCSGRTSDGELDGFIPAHPWPGMGNRMRGSPVGRAGFRQPAVRRNQCLSRTGVRLRAGKLHEASRTPPG